MRTIQLLISRTLTMSALLLSLLTAAKLTSQSLPLIEAYALLEANYPVLQNAGLNERILQTELDILDLERKPSLYLKGSASIQSETVNLGEGGNIPISIDLPLYNARAYGEFNYKLYDGGRLEARKKVTTAEGKLANQQLEIERFGLRQRINQFFLGILLSRERRTVFETTLADIAARKEAIAAAVELGAVLESELLQLRVREIEIEANRDDLDGQTERLLANLSTLIGRQLHNDIELTLPNLPELTAQPDLLRPEFQLFQLQKEAIMANNDLIDASRKLVVSAFAQAGLGLPNPLNLFDNGIAPYAIAGVNGQWKIKDWGKSNKQKQLLELQAMKLQKREETLRFNLNAGNEAYLADVQRLQVQVKHDEQVADLQAEILTQLSAQFDNGVITASDYLTQVNAGLRSRQQLKIHETELQQVQLNFLNDRGRF